MQMMTKKELGAWGESVASEQIARRGFVLLEKNFRCRIGEVDIVAMDNKTLTFIEVKTRTSLDFGFPSEAINPSKKHKYHQIALSYINHKRFKDIEIRFDVIEILLSKNGSYTVNHIKNAF